MSNTSEMDTIAALQEADKASQKLVGKGIAKAFFLDYVNLFSRCFSINPWFLLTGEIKDNRVFFLYKEHVEMLAKYVHILYGTPEAEALQVIDNTAKELLDRLKKVGDDK